MAFLCHGYAAVDAWLGAYYRLCHLAEPSGGFAMRRTVFLRANQVMSFTRRQVTCIEVQQGIVWLTGTPAAGDVILRAGEQCELGAASPYVVQALDDATILVLGR